VRNSAPLSSLLHSQPAESLAGAAGLPTELAEEEHYPSVVVTERVDRSAGAVEGIINPAKARFIQGLVGWSVDPPSPRPGGLAPSYIHSYGARISDTRDYLNKRWVCLVDATCRKSAFAWLNDECRGQVGISLKG
jgi:hypothetical protein